jgi:hypothetical protein
MEQILRPRSIAIAGLLACLPLAAFVLAVIVADGWSVPWRSVDHQAMFSGRSLPAYLAFIVVPCSLPLVFSRPGWIRHLVLIVLTAVSVVAGVSIPLTGVVLVAHAVGLRRR